MKNRKPFYDLGIGFCILSTFMLAMVPLAISFDEAFAIAGFLSGGVISGFIGGGILLINRRRSYIYFRSQPLLCLLILWIGLPCPAAFPFYDMGIGGSVFGALFEAVSGLTTTGATVLSRPENAPSIVLLWRSILHGFGGGLTLFSIIYILAPNGFSFIRPSMWGEKGGDIAIYRFGSIILVYMGGILISFSLLSLFGIPVFDALCIALSSISTGGFMPHSSGLGIYDSIMGEMIVALSMIFGALNFFVYGNFVHGLFFRGSSHVPSLYLRDMNVFFFFLFLLSVFLSISFFISEHASIFHYIWHGFFYAVSILTTSGIGEGHTLSEMFLIPICIFLMIGGSACSTTGGIKTHNFTSILRQSGEELKRLIFPHGVRTSRIEGNDIFISWTVFLLFLLGVIFFSVLFGLIGIDFSSSLLGAVSILSNGGGVITLFSETNTGISNGYGGVPDWIFVLLSLGMIIGRVEFLCIIAIVTLIRHKSRYI